MEYIDVLDESGNKLGLVKERAEVHKDGDWHGAVHVWVMNENGELLLQHRSPQVLNHPGMWDVSAAGHITAGDTSEATALRELKEELGINVRHEQLTHLFRVNQQTERADYINNEVDDVYLVELTIKMSDITLQKEEVSEATFVSLFEFDQMVQRQDSKLVMHPAEYEQLLKILDKRFKNQDAT